MTCVALVSLGGVLEGLSLFLLAPILNAVLHMTAGSGPGDVLVGGLSAMGLKTPESQLAAALSGFIVLMAVRALVLLARDRALWDLQTSFIESERTRAVRALASAPWSRIASLQHARVSTVLGVEMQRIAVMVTFTVQVCVALATLMVQAVAAFWISPVMGGVAMVLGLAIFATGLGPMSRSRHAGEALGAANLALASLTANILSGLKAAVAQGTQPRFLAEFESVQTQLRAGQGRYVLGQARGRSVSGLLTAVVAAAVIWAGVAVFAVKPPVLIVLILIFSRMSAPLMLVQQGVQHILTGLPAFEAARRLESELADEVGNVPASSPAASRSPRDVSVVLEGVTFRRPDGGGVGPIDAQWAAGAMIGLNGPSGAGKTTLIDLLAGLLRPQEGRIRIGSQSLDNISDWGAQIAYVGQDPVLFYDTVRRNLLFAADPDANDDALWAALAMVGADGLVRSMAHGLDTLIGERGALISGGERQRLALAGALLRRPGLLLLDEATSALDVAAEAAIFKRLAARSDRPTIVLVAHRAETLANCDTILAIERPPLR